MKLILQVYFILSTIVSIAQSNKIVISIDDVPCANCKTLLITENVNDKLISTFKKFNVPAIGFVNEIKLYNNKLPETSRIEILEQWLRNGYELGNHTFSHVDINKLSIEEYETDILRGEIITKPMMKRYGEELIYFRHPQLRTGSTAEYKNQLDSILLKHHYTTAPVTMDNDEFIYAYCYKKAKERNDSSTMKIVADDYISYMNDIFIYYEKLSIDFLSYNLSHILLLHANELNADYLDEILQVLINRNYSFITLEEALKDKAYMLPESFSDRGISWIDRWKLAKGMEITSQPKVSENIQLKYEQYRSLSGY
ncbi:MULTISPECIES: polysaccharide deacetylase family protein [unclassified Lentimicrobium]|uniref:polysaccharide deacetylase family protein n=1 Tax=unclassified Lentimicrobium TaxID=2677434 RepID=UPI0015558802|nr:MULTISPECIES: polysaccharide deacetylase family protein [unclassified Lentimicrobium]NPD47991.1 polysaccharide deacetylase family protein [Lentimicrobium sp. S6]NPD86036.1 polysaccharide deacetylase family protein [Lentimicrobium sp. L6]